MGRGVARDRLPNETAEQVRKVIREVRLLKRVTNAEISVHLGWGDDARRFVDALAPKRPLRSATAVEVLVGLLNMPPRNAQATKLLRDASELVGGIRKNPPVLIASWALDDLAQHLADELSRKPGVGAKRRDVFADDVRYALGRTAAGMALSFFDACWTRLEGDDTAGKVLKSFGYSLPEPSKKGR